MNPIYKKLGAHFIKPGTCRFCVFAPLKNTIEVLINNEAYPLKKDTYGYWAVEVNNVKEGDTYFFKIDNSEPLPDIASLSQPESVHKASEIIDVTTFKWLDNNWKGIEMRDLIKYELHAGTFTEEGTFDAVINKLDYLKELGITALNIMPVNQFPGERSWGYDGVFCFAAQNSYGGPRGLQRLVNAAHAKGLAIILDVVYNHVGPEGNYLADYAPFFTDKYKTPWGASINFDDAYSYGVRNYFLQNALMWLRDFKVDGLRIDAADNLWDTSAHHFIKELSEEVRILEKETGCRKLLIAEFDTNDIRFTNAINLGGYGLDGQWHDGFHHAIRTYITKQNDGYYIDYGTPKHIENAFNETYIYNGEFSKFRNKNHGGKSENIPFDRFVVFSQNHDQVGNRLLSERPNAHMSFDQMKMVAANYILSPYIPMLFMGEEYGEDKPFQYFNDFGDEALRKGMREGRQKEFAHFGWKEMPPDPLAKETFLQCKLSWSVEHDENAKLMFNYYKHLINLRKTLPVLQCKERSSVTASMQDQVLIVKRSCNNDKALIIINFSKEEAQHDVTGYNDVIFCSSDEQWNGKRSSILNKNIITLAPQSATLIQ